MFLKWAILSVASIFSVAGVGAQEPERATLSAMTWRVEYDNDIFFDSDNKFTSGLSVQRHSNVAEEWADLDMPAWTKFGKTLPGLRSADLYRRMTFAIGQNMQTPDDIGATEPIVNDVPYAGSFGFGLTWMAFDNESFRGYELIGGFIGPLSGAEQTQKLAHKIIGADEPRGWKNQLSSEPAVNFNGMFKKKLGKIGRTDSWSADLSLNADFGVGTALVFAESGLEARVGWNVPRGFVFLPDPVGRSVSYDANYEGDDDFSVYLSAVARGVAMPFFIFLDGSLFRSGRSVDKETFFSQTIVGLHLHWRRWGLHLSSWKTSGSVNPGGAPDPNNDFGTVAIEWRF